MTNPTPTPRPGQMGTVRVRFAGQTAKGNQEFETVALQGRPYTSFCAPSEIVSVEEEPLKVGDRVSAPINDEPASAQIIAIHGRDAWVEFDEYRLADGRQANGLRLLTALERVP